MQLIPAIDIKDGQCVRLRRGDMAAVTAFYDDPRDAARHWLARGARRLHIVDLDGACAGAPVNFRLVQDLARLDSAVPVQVGGGIRTLQTAAKYIDAGARFIIIGTQAVRAPNFVKELCAEFPGRIIVSIDARDGRVATDGWTKNSAPNSAHAAIDLAQAFAADGVCAIIYTDIARDGMLSGVNLADTKRLAAAIDMPVIAAGGMHNLQDIRALADLAGDGVIGAITGRAIYEGTLDFAAGQRLADELARPAAN